MTPITEEEVEAARSPAGGFTKATLARWGIQWPPVKGWRETIIAHGIPYDHSKNAWAAPEDAPADTAALLRQVILAVVEAGRADILYDLPEVLDYLGSRIPAPEEVAHLHGIDSRMWPAAPTSGAAA